MDTKIENPFAFPLPSDWYTNPNEGMTLLDWFAGQALVGINANPYHYGLDHNDCARLSYNDAEAMLAERQRRLSQ